MRMPRSIKVGHRRFEVISWQDKAAEAEEARGDCREEPPTIRIARSLTRPDKAETMIHEVLHACWRGLASENVAEEQAVSVLAEHFAQVWSDNPDLVAWLSDCLFPKPPGRIARKTS